MPELYKGNKDKWDNMISSFSITGIIIFTYVFTSYLFGYASPFMVGYILSLILEPLAKAFCGQRHCFMVLGLIQSAVRVVKGYGSYGTLL